MFFVLQCFLSLFLCHGYTIELSSRTGHPGFGIGKHGRGFLDPPGTEYSTWRAVALHFEEIPWRGNLIFALVCIYFMRAQSLVHTFIPCLRLVSPSRLEYGTIRGDTGMMAPGLRCTKATGDLLSPGGTRNLVRPPQRVRQGQGYLPTGGVVVVRRRRKAELQRDAASQTDVSRPSAGRSANTRRRQEQIIVIGSVCGSGLA